MPWPPRPMRPSQLDRVWTSSNPHVRIRWRHFPKRHLPKVTRSHRPAQYPPKSSGSTKKLPCVHADPVDHVGIREGSAPQPGGRAVARDTGRGARVGQRALADIGQVAQGPLRFADPVPPTAMLRAMSQPPFGSTPFQLCGFVLVYSVVATPSIRTGIGPGRHQRAARSPRPMCATHRVRPVPRFVSSGCGVCELMDAGKWSVCVAFPGS